MIFNIQRFSLHDGDGVRTVVFLKGCPLHCAWCSNPESQAFGPEVMFDPGKCIGCGDCRQPDFLCPAEARTVAGEEKTVDAILAEVEKDKVFYKENGGLTLSGGEPFSQPGLAAELFARAKASGLSTGVETCLAVPWRNIEPSLPHLDSIYADVKHTDPVKYREWTGGDLGQVLDNLSRLAARASGAPVAARVPVIPGFNDTDAELHAIAAHVAALATVARLHLLPFHNLGQEKYRLLGRDYRFAGIPSTKPESLADTADRLCAAYPLEILIGG